MREARKYPNQYSWHTFLDQNNSQKLQQISILLRQRRAPISYFPHLWAISFDSFVAETDKYDENSNI